MPDFAPATGGSSLYRRLRRPAATFRSLVMTSRPQGTRQSVPLGGPAGLPDHLAATSRPLREPCPRLQARWTTFPAQHWSRGRGYPTSRIPLTGKSLGQPPPGCNTPAARRTRLEVAGSRTCEAGPQLSLDMTMYTRTSRTELRAVFNAYVLPRVQSGEYDELVEESSTSHPDSGQPPGTRSQRVVYLQGGRRVAIAHRFVLPDGSVGGSGRPDPKAVLFEGQWLIASPARQIRRFSDR